MPSVEDYDALTAEVEQLRAEADRMRPVYEAAVKWRAHPYQNDHSSEECACALINAIDAATEGKP
jgi:hypothetical protein